MRNSFVTNIQKVIMPKLFVSRWSVGVCVPVSKTSKNEKRKKNYAGVSIKELFEIDFFHPFILFESGQGQAHPLCAKKKKKEEWILWPYFRKIGRDLGKKLAGGEMGVKGG